MRLHQTHQSGRAATFSNTKKVAVCSRRSPGTLDACEKHVLHLMYAACVLAMPLMCLGAPPAVGQEPKPWRWKRTRAVRRRTPPSRPPPGIFALQRSSNVSCARFPERGCLALAFLFAIGIIHRNFACPVCGTDWPISQRLRRRREREGDEYFSYSPMAPIAATNACCRRGNRERRYRPIFANTFLEGVYSDSLMDVAHCFVCRAFGTPATVVDTDLYERAHDFVPDCYRLFRQRAGRYVALHATMAATVRAQVDDTFLNKWKRGDAFQASQMSAHVCCGVSTSNYHQTIMKMFIIKRRPMCFSWFSDYIKKLPTSNASKLGRAHYVAHLLCTPASLPAATICDAHPMYARCARCTKTFCVPTWALCNIFDGTLDAP